VVQERDAAGAVRIVLDRNDLGRHTGLVALEVDDAIALLVAATLEARGDAAVVVASTRRVRGLEQRLLRRLVRRELGEIEARHAATAGRRRLIGFHLPRLPRRTRSCCPERASRSPSSSSNAGP